MLGDIKEYAVVYVDDDALPEDDDWVFIQADGTLYFAIKKDHVTPKALASAWGAFREMVVPVAA